MVDINTPVLEKKKYVCLLDRTGNNLFMRLLLKDKLGMLRLVKQISVGQVGINGPKKRTVYSAEVVGKKMAEYLKMNNVTYIHVIIRSKKKLFYFFRYALRPFKRNGIFVTKIKFYYIRSHNGTRAKRAKRR